MEEGLLTTNVCEVRHPLPAPHPVTLSYSPPDCIAAQPFHVADPQLA